MNDSSALMLFAVATYARAAGCENPAQAAIDVMNDFRGETFSEGMFTSVIQRVEEYAREEASEREIDAHEQLLDLERKLGLRDR